MRIERNGLIHEIYTDVINIKPQISCLRIFPVQLGPSHKYVLNAKHSMFLSYQELNRSLLNSDNDKVRTFWRLYLQKM